jgi:hypothetical protein
MKRSNFSVAAQVLLVVLALLAGADEAAAALGQAPSVATAASATTGATGARMLTVTPGAAGPYTVQETLLSSGTLVREYTDASGIVFAVSWQGPTLPDLAALLGGYFPTFQAHTDQVRAAGIRRAPVNMARDGLVLKSLGHARNFYGNAYAPALVPTGVDINHVLQ